MRANRWWIRSVLHEPDGVLERPAGRDAVDGLLGAPGAATQDGEPVNLEEEVRQEVWKKMTSRIAAGRNCNSLRFTPEIGRAADDQRGG